MSLSMRAGWLIGSLLLGCVDAPASPAPSTPPPQAKERAVHVERQFVSNKVPAVHVEWLVITLPSESAGAAITSSMERSARTSAQKFIAAAREAKQEEPRDLGGMPS